MIELLKSVLVTVGATAIIAVITWLAGPLKWLFENHRIKKIILRDRKFVLLFNPIDRQKKIISFCENGEMDEGKNENENRWRTKRGKLEIIHQDNKLYSQFKHEMETGKFIHTNSHKTRSASGQEIIPLWEDIPKDEDNNKDYRK